MGALNEAMILFLSLITLLSDDFIKEPQKLETYVLSGTITNQKGDLALIIDVIDEVQLVTIAATDKKKFIYEIQNQTPYNIKIREHPPGQNCTVLNGEGTIYNEDVTDIRIICRDN